MTNTHDDFEYIEVQGFKLKFEIKDGKRIFHLNANDVLLMKHEDGRHLSIWEHEVGHKFWGSLVEEMSMMKTKVVEEFFSLDLEEEEWQEEFPQIVKFISWLTKVRQLEKGKKQDDRGLISG